MHEELFEYLARELNITRIKQTKNSIEVVLPKELNEKINIEELFIKLSNYRFYRLSSRFNQIVITLDIIKLDKHFIYYLIDLLDIIKSVMKG
jgi:transcription-repair coupling factor (superfamily II helicase)